MELPATIYIAIGTVIAAFIAGSFSFINLINTKEQKTSEFRQNWIDSLREDIAKFTAHVGYVSAKYEFMMHSKPDFILDEEGYEKFVSTLSSSFIEMSTTLERIKLRLNPEEHKILIEHLQKTDDLFHDIKKISDYKLVSTQVELVTKESQKILKNEWKRVKRGEPAFFLTKYTVLFVFVIFIIGIVAYYR